MNKQKEIQFILYILSKKKGGEKMFSKHDPVCGVKVSKKSEYSLEFQGKVYYFDSEACQATFKEKPERFLKKKRGFLKWLAKGNKDVPKCCHDMKQ